VVMHFLSQSCPRSERKHASHMRYRKFAKHCLRADRFFVQTAAVLLTPIPDSISWINLLNFAPQGLADSFFSSLSCSFGPRCVFLQTPLARLALRTSAHTRCAYVCFKHRLTRPVDCFLLAENGAWCAGAVCLCGGARRVHWHHALPALVSIDPCLNPFSFVTLWSLALLLIRIAFVCVSKYVGSRRALTRCRHSITSRSTARALPSSW
jgi:hypothetical protein